MRAKAWATSCFSVLALGLRQRQRASVSAASGVSSISAAGSRARQPRVGAWSAIQAPSASASGGSEGST